MLRFTGPFILGTSEFFRNMKEFSLTFFSDGKTYSYQDLLIVSQARAISCQGTGGFQNVLTATADKYFSGLCTKRSLTSYFVSRFKKAELSLTVAEGVDFGVPLPGCLGKQSLSSRRYFVVFSVAARFLITFSI